MLDWQCCRGVAQSGSAPAWGAGGRWFESNHPDHSCEIRRDGSCTGVVGQGGVASASLAVLASVRLRLAPPTLEADLRKGVWREAGVLDVAAPWPVSRLGGRFGG